MVVNEKNNNLNAVGLSSRSGMSQKYYKKEKKISV